METMTQTLIPALRQSLAEVASCPTSYAYQVIEGKTMPGGLQSARGTEIHAVMSQYISHCATRKVVADWAKFDELAIGAGSEAADILNGLRDSYQVDHEHVYDTEVHLGWAEDGIEAEGTLDVLLADGNTHIKIEDFKSHPRPFDPDTFQSRLYPWLVLQHFPEVEEITFELIFVRYANCRRSVTYTRADLPTLTQHVVNHRRRQVEIHERYAAGEPLAAFPGNHCQYCPLLQRPNGCPISDFNPHAAATPEERLRFAVWLNQVKKVNDDVLKSVVDASGQPILIVDGNDRPTQIGYVDHESKQFPLLKVLPLLMEYRETTPNDIDWLDKLLIGSTQLKSYLKAKKRAFLHQCVEDTAAVTVSKPKFEISVPAEQVTSEQRNEWED